MIRPYNREEIVHFIHNAITETLSRPDLLMEIQEDTILQSLGIDSVVTIHLVVQIELEYGVFFEDDELLIDNFASSGLLANLIIRKISEAS